MLRPRSTSHLPPIVAFRILSSRVLDVTFTSFVCVLTFFTVSLLGFGSVRGNVSGMSLRGDFRGWFTSLLFSTARIQYTIHVILNVREGRT